MADKRTGRSKLLLVGIAGLVVVIALAAVVVTGVRYWTLRGEENARESARVAAEHYSVTMFSWNPKNVAANIDESMGFLTGSAKTDFQRNVTDNSVVEGVKRDNIVSTVTIQGAGVMSNTRDTAKVLVFVNQSSTRGDQEEVKLDASRIVYDMERRSGKWFIQAIDILTDESLRSRIQKVDDPKGVPVPGPTSGPTSPAATPSPSPSPAP